MTFFKKHKQIILFFINFTIIITISAIMYFILSCRINSLANSTKIKADNHVQTLQNIQKILENSKTLMKESNPRYSNFIFSIDNIDSKIKQILDIRNEQRRDDEIKKIFAKQRDIFTNENLIYSVELKNIMTYLIKCCEVLDKEIQTLNNNYSQLNNLAKETRDQNTTTIQKVQKSINTSQTLIKEAREYLNPFASILELTHETLSQIEPFVQSDKIEEKEKKVWSEIIQDLPKINKEMRTIMISSSRNGVARLFANLRSV